ncbi:hypothetical protein UCDDA912_g08347 [Diaporthe ampelina]|uniref:Uncharacterized protein n=1 Tax=Diaporthe ampelina TaxID=1214573 RepID=A0A0G2FBY2_9PEZI|nr:hypothetical protein UCDDA912_g08347 [Diaporthe ampelina]
MSGRVQSVGFESIDLDLDFANIFDTDNAVDENPDHIEPTLQMPSRLEVVLPPDADTDLYQAFDEDLVQYDSGGMEFDGQPCDVIPSMFPMELDYEKLSDQVLSDQVPAYLTNDRRNDAAPIATFDIPEDVQPFTEPQKSQRNEQLDMYIPAYFSLRDL